MTSPIATSDAVKAAALALSDLGQPVTLDAVIKHIGGGSKSTVGPLLRELLPQLGLVRSEAADIPPPVRSALNRAAVTLWNAAQEQARYESQDIQKRYESFLAGQDRDMTAISAERDELAQRNTELETALRELSAQHLVTQQMVRDREEELHLVAERYQRAEGDNLKLREALERVEAEQGGDRKQLLDLMMQLQTQFSSGNAVAVVERAKG